jgi:transcriptional regulator with XRE-family HTH domain
MSDDEVREELAADRELAELLQQGLSRDLEELAADVAAQAQLTRKAFEWWEKSFGDKVRQWRRERNWSQEEVADQLRRLGFDMHQTTVAKIERGTRPLRVAEAAAIATIFRVSPLAVFLGPPPTLTPWPLEKLHDTIASAQNMLEEMKNEMHRSAERYVDQETYVLGLARMLNQTALEAEKMQQDKRDAKDEGADDAEA